MPASARACVCDQAAGRNNQLCLPRAVCAVGTLGDGARAPAFSNRPALHRMDPCCVCGRAGVGRCAGCAQFTYCSDLCRDVHWDGLGHAAHCATCSAVGGDDVLVRLLLDGSPAAGAALQREAARTRTALTAFARDARALVAPRALDALEAIVATGTGLVDALPRLLAETEPAAMGADAAAHVLRMAARGLEQLERRFDRAEGNDAYARLWRVGPADARDVGVSVYDDPAVQRENVPGLDLVLHAALFRVHALLDTVDDVSASADTDEETKPAVAPARLAAANGAGGGDRQHEQEMERLRRDLRAMSRELATTPARVPAPSTPRSRRSRASSSNSTPPALTDSQLVEALLDQVAESMGGPLEATLATTPFAAFRAHLMLYGFRAVMARLSAARLPPGAYTLLKELVDILRRMRIIDRGDTPEVARQPLWAEQTRLSNCLRQLRLTNPYFMAFCTVAGEMLAAAALFFAVPAAMQAARALGPWVGPAAMLLGVVFDGNLLAGGRALQNTAALVDPTRLTLAAHFFTARFNLRMLARLYGAALVLRQPLAFERPAGQGAPGHVMARLRMMPHTMRTPAEYAHAALFGLLASLEWDELGGAGRIPFVQALIVRPAVRRRWIGQLLRTFAGNAELAVDVMGFVATRLFLAELVAAPVLAPAAPPAGTWWAYLESWNPIPRILSVTRPAATTLVAVQVDRGTAALLVLNSFLDMLYGTVSPGDFGTTLVANVSVQTILIATGTTTLGVAGAVLYNRLMDAARERRDRVGTVVTDAVADALTDSTVPYDPALPAGRAPATAPPMRRRANPPPAGLGSVTTLTLYLTLLISLLWQLAQAGH